MVAVEVYAQKMNKEDKKTLRDFTKSESCEFLTLEWYESSEYAHECQCYVNF